MVTDSESVKLCDYCFNVCEALNMMIREKKTGDLNASTKMTLEGLERYADQPRILGLSAHPPKL